MGSPEEQRPGIQPWEFKLIKTISHRFRTSEPDDLEADLAAGTLRLKDSFKPDVRDWKSYLAKFLFNRASNWVRDRRHRDLKTLSIDAPIGDTAGASPWSEHLAYDEPEHDSKIAFSSLWEVLSPDLRELWLLLLEERGNQVKVAERLGKHRNTIRKWIGQIKQLIEKHNF